jgi:hypothetical protein
MEHFMMKIDTFLEAWEQDEKTKEQQRYKRSQPRAYSTKMPKSFFEHPVYQDIKEVIIPSGSQIVIPRRWEELEIDFLQKDKRYCKLCNLAVYRISNIYRYKELAGKNVAIAIPVGTPLLKALGTEDVLKIDYYRFIQISRRVIQEAGYRQEDDLYSCEVSRVVDRVLEYFRKKVWIDKTVWFDRYRELGFELERFLVYIEKSL